MLDQKSAQRIGGISGIKAAALGLFSAYLIMFLLICGDGIIKALLWVFHVDNGISLLLAIIFCFICGYFCGKVAGVEILIGHKDYVRIGIKYSFLTLFIVAFISGMINFLIVIISHNVNEDAFGSYVIKPIFLATLFGAIPTLAIGIWLGHQIQIKGTGK
jgi:hypothetical protein